MDNNNNNKVTKCLNDVMNLIMGKRGNDVLMEFIITTISGKFVSIWKWKCLIDV